MRQTGYDTYHNDEGDTVADTAVGDSLTEPHHEHRTGHEDEDGYEIESKIAPTEITHSHECLCRNLTVDRGQISRTLDADNHDGQNPGHLVHLLTTALALHLEFAEVRDKHSKQLDDDGSRDVRHHTQREDGGVTEGTTGEHVQKAYKTFA